MNCMVCGCDLKVFLERKENAEVSTVMLIAHGIVCPDCKKESKVMGKNDRERIESESIVVRSDLDIYESKTDRLVAKAEAVKLTIEAMVKSDSQDTTKAEKELIEMMVAEIKEMKI